MNLYELTKDAISKVDTYKSPDIDEWKCEIDKVLEALGKVKVGSDCIDKIYEYGHQVFIQTSYTVRCCSQTNRMNIPMIILRSPYPLKVANLYRLRSSIASETAAVKNLQSDLDKRKSQLSQLHKELRDLNLGPAEELPSILPSQHWCCGAGCGECTPTQINVPIYEERNFAGDLVEQIMEKVWVSDCCFDSLMLWDNETSSFVKV